MALAAISLLNRRTNSMEKSTVWYKDDIKTIEGRVIHLEQTAVLLSTFKRANRSVLLASPQILGSRRLQLLRAAHLPPLQLNNMSRTGATLLGIGQWKGEKGGRSFGGASRMNAAAQTAGQFADNRKPSTAPDEFRCRPIVRYPALYDHACKH
jgi:hypothetical protein